MHAYDQMQLVTGTAQLVDALARVEEAAVTKAWLLLAPLIEPMIIGCLPIGLAGGVAFYILARVAIRNQPGRRRTRQTASRESTFPLQPMELDHPLALEPPTR